MADTTQGLNLPFSAEMPDLLYPGREPTGPVKLDPDHWIWEYEPICIFNFLPKIIVPNSGVIGQDFYVENMVNDIYSINTSDNFENGVNIKHELQTKGKHTFHSLIRTIDDSTISFKTTKNVDFSKISNNDTLTAISFQSPDREIIGENKTIFLNNILALSFMTFNETTVKTRNIWSGTWTAGNDITFTGSFEYNKLYFNAVVWDNPGITVYFDDQEDSSKSSTGNFNSAGGIIHFMSSNFPCSLALFYLFAKPIPKELVMSLKDDPFQIYIPK